MMRKLIEEYVNRLSKQDILDFATKNGIELGDDELKLIHKHIKENWQTIVYGNPRGILDDIKMHVDDLTYEKIENLYSRFHEKYQSYL